MSETEPEDFESILKHIYGKGYYLQFLLILCSMTSFMAAFDIQSMIFMHHVPEHNCSDPRISATNATVYWLPTPHANPLEENATHTPHLDESTEQCWALVVEPSSTRRLTCSNWTYAVTVMHSTVATQFNLVCDRHRWIPWLESTYLFANAIGFLMASVGDVIGRRIPYMLFVLMEVGTCLATPFVNSIGLLLCLRCLRGLTIALNYLGVNLVSELVPIQHRAAYGNVFWFLWGVGYVTCAGLAYLTREWIQLRLWMCIFFIFYLGFPFIVCESPRWLCLHGRPKEASSVLKRVAFWNFARLSDEYFEKMDVFLEKESKRSHRKIIHNSNHTPDLDSLKEPEQRDSLRDLFTSPKLRLRSIIFCFVHSAITIVYFGLITNDSLATDNIFLNVFLMGLAELPTSLVGWAVCVYGGRRLSLAVILGITGVCMGITEVASLLHFTVRAVVAFVGKFFLSVAYCVADLYIVELFPTSIRSVSFFTVTTVAGLFAALAPFINNLRYIAFFLPTVIYCLVSMMGSLLVFVFLPETRDCPLAQTVAEAEQLVRGKEYEWSEAMRQAHQGVVIRGQSIEVIETEK